MSRAGPADTVPFFLEKFVPPTRREELHIQFEKLCYEGM